MTRTLKFEVELSPWANYVAMDADGSWWEFEMKPSLAVFGEEWSNPPYSNSRRLGRFYTPPGTDWTQELYEVK